MTRPVDWWGRQVEARSRAAVERMSEAWWRRFVRRRAVTLWTAEALVLAAALAGVIFLWSGKVLLEQQRAGLAAAEAAIRDKQEALQARTCLEWPAWCREARPGWWARYRKEVR